MRYPLTGQAFDLSKMDYQKQAAYLADYRFHWLVCASALLVAASICLRTRSVNSLLLFSTIMVVSGSLFYLPNYLHIHQEPDKRYRWAVRVRWITITAVGLPAWPATAAHWHPVLIGAIAWLLMANLMVKLAYRRMPAASFDLAFLYAVADFWMVVVLAFLGTSWLLVAALLVFGAHFAVLLYPDAGTPWFPVLAITLSAGLLRNSNRYDAEGFSASYLILLTLLTTIATAWLVRSAVRQARANYLATVQDLREFTGLSQEETEQRLMSSRAALVESWQREKPSEDDPAALARWYADNSMPYLFDIARFHLTFKHITFTLDVIRLSGSHCLDYGGGSGALSLALAKAGKQVVYFDVPGESRRYAEWKAQRAKVSICFTSERERIHEAAAEQAFDTVISLDVLEHLPNLASELEFLDSVLTPNGTMLLTVPVGATQSHPMHLAHSVDTRQFLSGRGYSEAKLVRDKLLGSEILRKRECVYMRKPSRGSLGQNALP